MAPPLTKDNILVALSSITFPGDTDNIVSAGRTSAIIIKDGAVGFSLDVPANQQKNVIFLQKQCEEAVKHLDGVTKVTVVPTMHHSHSTIDASTSKISSQQKQSSTSVGSQATAQPIKGVSHTILVASGKGGVGKSTLAYTLARTLIQQHHRVGLLDADIFGPSIPHLVGMHHKPELADNNTMIPLLHEGIQTMSIGYLVPTETATVWRGPMVTKSLHQLFRFTAWDNVDFLIVDMPPGTGDTQLSIAQQYPISGVVLVSTPQQLAIADVRKAADMFSKVKIPILGLIENMAYYQDPDTGKKHYIFGKDGGKTLAKELNTALLAQIPIQSENCIDTYYLEKSTENMLSQIKKHKT